MLRHKNVSVALVALSISSGAAMAEDAPEALAVFDDTFIAATLTDACNPSFDWSKTQKGIAEISARAFNEMLAKVHEVDPGGEAAEDKANTALDLRTKALLRQGKDMVAEKGCQDPELQKRIKDFADRAW
jgi:hypothetical protein